MSVCVCLCRSAWEGMCGDQCPTFRNWFSASTMWVSRTQTQVFSLVTGAVLSHLTGLRLRTAWGH